MSVNVNLVGFYGRTGLVPRPQYGLLIVSVRIRENHSVSGNVNPLIDDLPLYFPTYVLRSPLLCQLYLQRSLSYTGNGHLLTVCHGLAQRMCSTAQGNRDVAAALAHDVHNMYNGFVFRADIELITTIAMPDDDLLGDQETTSNMADIYNIVTTGGGGQVEFYEVDQVMIFGDVTTTSRSPTTSITQRRPRPRPRPIDKLRKTEHELVDAGDDNVRDQLGDGECCSICMEDYLHAGNKMNVKNIKLVRFGCTHIYHQKCILQWLDKHNSCPLCRRPLY